MEFVELIDQPKAAEIRILEIGCCCGGTLMKIKSVFPNALLFGIEFNPARLEVAKLFIPAVDGNAQGVLEHFQEGFFDYIIFGENLHQIDQPLQTLTTLINYLKGDGCLAAIVPNLMHYDVIRSLIQGTIDKAQLNYYKLTDVQSLFENAGFENIQITGLNVNRRPDDEVFIQKLAGLSDASISKPFEVSKFLIKAVKTEISHTIVTIIDELQLEHNMDENLNKLKNYDVSKTIDIIVKRIINPTQLLNQLAILNFQQKYNDHILPYLKKAIELDSLNPNTLYNLGYILYSFGEAASALAYLQLIENKDEDVIQLIHEISELI
jgi:tetratricopeptide (TPR) repeat protein